MTDPISRFVDDSMLALFIQEGQPNVALIDDTLHLAADPQNNPQQIDNMLQSACNLKSAANLVGFTAVAETAQLLESFFKQLSRNRRPATVADLTTVTQCVAHLEQIFSCDLDTLRQQKESLCAALSDSTLQLAALLNHHHPSPAAPPDAADTAAPPAVEPNMLELFQQELDTHCSTLTKELLALEKHPDDNARTEALMRAAHSIKGAARMVNLEPAVVLAHLMEDCFSLAKNNKVELIPAFVDALLSAVDLLPAIAESSEHAASATYHALCDALRKVLDQPQAVHDLFDDSQWLLNDKPDTQQSASQETVDTKALRIGVEQINTLVGLSGEMLIGAGHLRSYTESLAQLKHKQSTLLSRIEKLRILTSGKYSAEQLAQSLTEILHQANTCQQLLGKQIAGLEDFDRRTTGIAERLNHELISSRMQPFADVAHGLQRMTRDLARRMNKEITLEIEGLDTLVDREVLEKIKAPLNHLLRNAIDHGIEPPQQRQAAGKDPAGQITLRVFHKAGGLSIVIEDDGQGVDLAALKKRAIDKQLVSASFADNLTEAELLQFLFLPGFTTRDDVTEYSGRGFGLDVAQTVAQELRGKIIPSSRPGQGLRIEFLLPLTLSLIRCLLVSIDGEAYAFPLARIDTLLKIDYTQLQTIENTQYIPYNGRLVGLVDAAQVLGKDSQRHNSEQLLTVIIGDHQNLYGLVVDQYLGEQSLATQAIDPRIGKVRDISTAAILDDGSPALVIDVDDMLRSIDKLIAERGLRKLAEAQADDDTGKAKRILVVDDSLTVREVERQLLETHGYQVEVAVDGMDGWNSVRLRDYDLVMTDIDMPRMNGIELVRKIKADPQLGSIPVMIVSYKDRPQDRDLGLEAGADYYFTKGGFRDDHLLEAVADLIGGAHDE